MSDDSSACCSGFAICCPRKMNARVTTEQASNVIALCNAVNVRGVMRAGVSLAAKRVRAVGSTRQYRSDTLDGGALKVQLKVKRKKVRGRGGYQSLGNRHRIAMAYDQDTKHKTLARKFEVHPKTIARNQVLIAATFMNVQLAWLERLVQMCESSGQSPISVCTSRKWDETKEIVSLPLIEGARMVKDIYIYNIYTYIIYIIYI
jgi:hypothetical protein